MRPHTKRFRPEISRRSLIGGVFVLAASLAACTGPLNFAGTTPNATQPFFVHAITGSPLAVSTALAFPDRSVTRVDGTYNFDVAFDINAQGFVVLLPPELVGQNPGGNRLVGIITGIGSYDAITEAPLSGYVLDSATVIRQGQAAVVQAQEPICTTTNPVSPYLYAKLVVDSIDLVGRGIYGRTMIGGDCGYRQLVAGIPSF